MHHRPRPSTTAIEWAGSFRAPDRSPSTKMIWSTRSLAVIAALLSTPAAGWAQSAPTPAPTAPREAPGNTMAGDGVEARVEARIKDRAREIAHHTDRRSAVGSVRRGHARERPRYEQTRHRARTPDSVDGCGAGSEVVRAARGGACATPAKADPGIRRPSTTRCPRNKSSLPTRCFALVPRIVLKTAPAIELGAVTANCDRSTTPADRPSDHGRDRGNAAEGARIRPAPRWRAEAGTIRSISGRLRALSMAATASIS